MHIVFHTIKLEKDELNSKAVKSELSFASISTEQRNCAIYHGREFQLGKKKCSTGKFYLLEVCRKFSELISKISL